jgi:two-component system, chemotaxis family, response regulator Rcp1
VSGRIQILLVEDTPSDVRLTKEALKDAAFDHQLSVVNDGEQAMDYLRQHANSPEKPDLLLLDLNMPKKNGHEVMDEMKELPEYQDTPVILLTVSQDEQDIAKALQLKMNYYLSKPVTGDKLETLLKAMKELATDSGAKLARGEDAHVRYVIAGNPHTSSAILARLAVERNPTIRTRVAENPNTPLTTLEQLIEDPSSEVRAGIAENPKAPTEMLERLSKDNNEDVRLAVAMNPRVPQQILRKLSGDDNGYVMSAAQKTLDGII